jgi:cytochrome b561
MLMALIALHVAGALYHSFFLKDQLLTRMFFGKRAIAAATISASPALKRPLSKVQS